MKITYENLTKQYKNYENWKNKQQEKADKFIEENIFFAYSDKQFDESMKEMGYTNEENIINLVEGTFCHKKDYEKVIKYFNKLGEIEQEFYATPENFYGALYYTLWNIEFVYNQDLQEVMDYMRITQYHLNKYKDYKQVIQVYLNHVEA